MKSPNHALQRTAPGGHAGCSHRLRPQPPFRSRRARPPQSLSLGSFAYMKIPLLLLLGSLMSSSAQSPSPQTIVPREDLKAALRGLWSQSGVSCGKVNYDLYAYTEKHPERVKFAGEDEVANVEGFVDYLASMSPITAPWAENGITVSLLFHEGKLLTPWGNAVKGSDYLKSPI